MKKNTNKKVRKPQVNIKPPDGWIEETGQVLTTLGLKFIPAVTAREILRLYTPHYIAAERAKVETVERHRAA